MGCKIDNDNKHLVRKSVFIWKCCWCKFYIFFEDVINTFLKSLSYTNESKRIFSPIYNELIKQLKFFNKTNKNPIEIISYLLTNMLWCV